MTPALVALLIEYAVKYGIPAVLELINTIKQPTMTWDDIQAAFKMAETPYGLTPELVAKPAPSPVAAAVAAAVATPPTTPAP